MIVNDKDGKMLLFCEPQSKELEPSINDDLSKKMREWLNVSKEASATKGVHVNPDGYESKSYNYILPTGQITHSLAVHYLTSHRSEIPKEQLDIIKMMPTVEEYNKATPSLKEALEKPVKFFVVPFIDRETMKHLYSIVKTELYYSGGIKNKADRTEVALKWRKEFTKNFKSEPKDVYLKDIINKIKESYKPSINI